VGLFLSHFFSFFLRGKKKRNETVVTLRDAILYEIKISAKEGNKRKNTLGYATSSG
jgi:hypothetical protein